MPTKVNIEERPKFVPVDFKYDPLYDIEEVDQFGFVDLRQAFLEGELPGDIRSDDSAYNGIDDPDAVMPHADDHFSAIRNAQSVTSAESAAAAKAKAATSGASE